MNPFSASRWRLLLISIVAGALVTMFVTERLFAGETFDAFWQNVTATQDWQNILMVNVLVGISVALFVYQLGWGALRVTATVAIALLLGYLVTGGFNLDNASRFTRGEFKIALISDAEKVDAEDVDIEYG